MCKVCTFFNQDISNHITKVVHLITKTNHVFVISMQCAIILILVICYSMNFILVKGILTIKINRKIHIELFELIK